MTIFNTQTETSTEASGLNQQSDYSAIYEVLLRQFHSLCWSPEQDADWSGFLSCFHSKALLFPAARPASPVTPTAFMGRMQGLRANGTLSWFSEKITSYDLCIHGNVASVTAGCEMLENQQKTTYDISVITFINDQGRWLIANQAWDAVTRAMIVQKSMV